MSKRGQVKSRQVDEIITLYCQSVPISIISKMYRQGRPTIYKVLERNEFSLHTQIHRVIPEECLDDLVDLYNLGYSTTAISEYIGCPISVIVRQLDEHGIDRRGFTDRKTKSHGLPPVLDTIDDEEWVATATVPDIIERMKALAEEHK